MSAVHGEELKTAILNALTEINKKVVGDTNG